jgi:hypothetical protein
MATNNGYDSAFALGRRRKATMKKILGAGVLLLVLCLTPTVAFAEDNPANGMSAGFILGDPTGITLRQGLVGGNAVQLHLGFSPFPGDAVAAMVDWTFDVWDIFRDNSSLSLPIYVGLGAKAQWFTGQYYIYDYHGQRRFPDLLHFGLGARGLVGLRASLRQAPIDLFMELAPLGVIFIVPNPGIYYDADFGLGARFRF